MKGFIVVVNDADWLYQTKLFVLQNVLLLALDFSSWCHFFSFNFVDPACVEVKDVWIQYSQMMLKTQHQAGPRSVTMRWLRWEGPDSSAVSLFPL